jgi:ribulose-5-phosphate 4-epimerase/fuculose-1-phosphate aldolase
MNNKEIKSDLAKAYQILAILKADDHTYTHLSSRAEDGKSLFIYPFGLTFAEVTEENLIQVTFDGEIISGSEYQYNRTGYIIHGELYKARLDINHIFHLHTHASVAVSAMKSGLIAASQWALHFYDNIAYHDYDSLSLESFNGMRLAEDLGKKFVMLLRNHGMITSGRTIAEAMFYFHHLEQACKAQIMMLSSGQEIIIPSEELCRKTVSELLTFEKNLGERDWKAWCRRLRLNAN